MKASEPSLFRLFSRSRYRTVLPNGDESGASAETEVRSERERFATAAVAFCLKHSPAFLRQFWQAICRGDHDPEIAPELEVALEPPAWADLRLIAPTAPRRAVWVIEFKLDAELADKQDPTNTGAFGQPAVGYGELFSASELPGTDLRYVVLGSKRLPTGQGEIADLGIRWQARRWRELVTAVPSPDSLTADLFTTLGQLGIAAFRMKEIETLAVTGDFRAAANAWDVLSVLGSADGCGFRPAYWNIAVETPVEGHFNVGAYLRLPPPKKPTSDLHENLAKAMGGAGGSVAWVGYETGGTVPGGFRRSIWFYCATQVQADSLRQRLASHASTSEPFADNGGLGVIATDLPGETARDFDWFSSVLRAAAE